MVDAEENVILVNDLDEVIGSANKIEAHRQGLKHRAFSVMLFNRSGEVLLQQRSLSKYHSPGLWANACCGHPRPGEGNIDAAVRRVQEELGIVVSLSKFAVTEYEVDFEDGLTENEYVHIYIGEYNGGLNPDQQEVVDYMWLPKQPLSGDIRRNSPKYTYWFLHYFNRFPNLFSA